MATALIAAVMASVAVPYKNTTTAVALEKDRMASAAASDNMTAAFAA